MLYVYVIKIVCFVNIDIEIGNWENWCLKIYVDMIFVDYWYNNILVRIFC